MGNQASNPEDNTAQRDQVVETSTGTHFFEVHMPTMGFGTITIILVGLGLIAAFMCLRSHYGRYKNHNHRDVESGFPRTLSVQPHALPIPPYTQPLMPNYPMRALHDTTLLDWPRATFERANAYRGSSRIYALPREERPARIAQQPAPAIQQVAQGDTAKAEDPLGLEDIRKKYNQAYEDQAR